MVRFLAGGLTQYVIYLRSASFRLEISPGTTTHQTSAKVVLRLVRSGKGGTGPYSLVTIVIAKVTAPPSRLLSGMLKPDFILSHPWGTFRPLQVRSVCPRNLSSMKLFSDQGGPSADAACYPGPKKKKPHGCGHPDLSACSRQIMREAKAGRPTIAVVLEFCRYSESNTRISRTKTEKAFTQRFTNLTFRRSAAAKARRLPYAGI